MSEIVRNFIKLISLFNKHIVHTIISLVVSILSIVIIDENFVLIKELGKEMFSLLVFLITFLICECITHFIKRVLKKFKQKIKIKKLSIKELQILYEFLDLDIQKFTSEYIIVRKTTKEHTSLRDRNILIRNDYISISTAYHLSNEALKTLNRPIIKRKIINLFKKNNIIKE